MSNVPVENDEVENVADLLALPPEGNDARVAPEPFAVRDEATANWLVRRVTEARQYATRVRSWAAQEIRRAETQEERLLYLYGAQLREWVGTELARNRSRTKSINLPAGACGFRHEKAKLIVLDHQTTIAWARANCSKAIAVEERLLKTSVTEHFNHTGELPPGTCVQPEHESFYIK